MKKIIIVLSTWIFFCVGSAITPSCESCNEGPFNFKLVSIAADVKKISGIELVGSQQVAYYTTETYVAQTNGIRYDSIGIDLFHTIELLSYDTRINFLNAAFACSPATNYQQLADMQIMSSENYSEGYPAGSDLKELMTIRQGYQLQGRYILAFLSNAELTEENLFFTFEFPPSQTKIHDITITYRLLDGREFNVFVPGLKISPA